MTVVARLVDDYKFSVTAQNRKEYNRLREATDVSPYRRDIGGLSFMFNLYDFNAIVGILTEHGILDRMMNPDLAQALKDIKKVKRLEMHDDLAFKRGLLNHQPEAVELMSGNSGFLLCDAVGLAKTSSAIAASLNLIHHGKVEHSIIMSNKSNIRKWKSEAKKMVGDVDVVEIYGSPERRKKLWEQNHVIYVTTPDSFKRDFEKYMNNSYFKNLFANSIGCYDEVHGLKDPLSKRSQAFTRWGPMLKYRWGMTATPIDGKLETLYAIFRFVHPELFCQPKRFYKKTGFFKYHVNLDFWGNPKSYNHIELVRDKIKPFMIRRKKRDVIDGLPDIITKEYCVQLSTKEKKLYKELEKVGKFDEKKGTKGKLTILSDAANARFNDTNLEVVANVAYMAMMCDSPGLIDPEWPEESSKMIALTDILEQIAEDNKVVVFTKYKMMVYVLQNYLKWDSEILCGDLTVEQRVAAQERFLTDPECRLFIMNTAGKESIDLHGIENEDGEWLDGASYMIKFDMMWNPAVNEQIDGRIDRVGQRNKMTVINMYCEDTLEDVGVRVKLLERMGINIKVLEKQGL